MRQVFDDPAGAQARGEAGRAAVAERQSVDRAADFVASRMPELERLGTRAGDARDLRLARLRVPHGRAERLVGRTVAHRTPRPDLPACAGTAPAPVPRPPARARDAPRRLGSTSSSAPATGSRTPSARSRPTTGSASTTRRADRAAPSELYAKPFEAAVGDTATRRQPLRRLRGDLPRVRGPRARAPRALRAAPPRPRACPRRRLRARRAAGAAARSRGRGQRASTSTKAWSTVPQEGPGRGARRRRRHISSGRSRASLGAVVASHVIEHLSYEELQRLFELARRALRPAASSSPRRSTCTRCRRSRPFGPTQATARRSSPRSRTRSR